MQIGQSVYLEENNETSPFMSFSAFAADGASMFMGYKFNKWGAEYETFESNIRKKAAGPFTKGLKEYGSSAKGSSAHKEYKNRNKNNKLRMGYAKGHSGRSKVADYYGNRARKFRATAKNFHRFSMLLTGGAAAMFAFDLTKDAMLGVASGYSAERAKREAISASVNDIGFYDSRIASTMRQRALQVIHNSQLSTRAAFGQEASYMFN